MIADFREAATASAFQTDICIVGSGAAGLTLACNLARSLRVLVVEAGGRDPGPGDATWLAGEISASVAFDGFENGRVRAFGGATRRWFGQCIRLDPIDFEKREWVPYSGWPLTAAEMAPYYDRAEDFLAITPHGYGASIWPRFGLRDPGFSNQDVTPRFTVYTPQPDFTRAYGKRLGTAGSLDILLNAAVTGIAVDAAGQRVTGLQIRSDGRMGEIRARAYVLCGGGIENPRLLLAARDTMPDGIGNALGLVGRFFQDHPTGTTGVIATSRPAALQRQFRKLRRKGVTFWPKLALTAAAQRRGRYLNANALMLYDYADGSAMTRAKEAVEALRTRRPAAAAKAALRLVRHVPELGGKAVHAVATGKAPVFEASRVMLKAHVEQVPDPENRVSLAAECDRFGVPRARLAWRVNADEIRTLQGITDAVGHELRRLGFGELTPAAWLTEQGAAREQLADTYHHAGTTRMATDPKDGVVDPDCRVFGIDNLYVAGSSVFPTSGYANPTLTIVALALRLSDTLNARMTAA